LDKNHFFKLQAYVYTDVLILERQDAKHNLGVIVAFPCIIALLLIGNCPEDRILFNELMHVTVNTGL
jgi:hypothetical protein